MNINMKVIFFSLPPPFQSRIMCHWCFPLRGGVALKWGRSAWEWWCSVTVFRQTSPRLSSPGVPLPLHAKTGHFSSTLLSVHYAVGAGSHVCAQGSQMWVMLIQHHHKNTQNTSRCTERRIRSMCTCVCTSCLSDNIIWFRPLNRRMGLSVVPISHFSI